MLVCLEAFFISFKVLSTLIKNNFIRIFPYSPLNIGSRFSLNAFNASILSVVGMTTS